MPAIKKAFMSPASLAKAFQKFTWPLIERGGYPHFNLIITTYKKYKIN